ncbi:hypothetical protein QYF36_009080 [Acer negundo]|nr:hypothetical protein QYF36_009080 [Acer negundo]
MLSDVKAFQKRNSDQCRPIARRRNIEMEKIEISHFQDLVVGCANLNTFPKRVVRQVHFKRRKNVSESSSSQHYENHQPKYTEIEIKQLEEILGTALKADIHEPSSHCCIYKR